MRKRKVKKFMRMTKDRQRVVFFAYSHLTGWMMANLQTIWLVWEIRRAIKILKK